MAEKEVSTSVRGIPDFKTLQIDQVLNHLKMLRIFDENTHLHQPHILHNAIRRYETCWLPLMAKYGQGEEGEKLVPPLDVAWIWHVHMLAPVRYHKDCARITGSVLENTFCAMVEGKMKDETLQGTTEKLWGETYPNEQYDIPVQDYNSIERDTNYEQKSGYNLIAAAERQKDFLYNVSLPHYVNNKFQTNAIHRYKKFIGLKMRNKAAFLVPMYDIDLVWHTHQLMATDYKRDMENYFGKIKIQEPT